MSKNVLVACPGCSRHIRVGEAACPFCGATVALVAPPRPRARGRLTRLALVAGVALAGTACGPASVPDDSVREQETYGDDIPPEEEEQVVEDDGGEDASDDVGEPVAMYGGPSVETIV